MPEIEHVVVLALENRSFDHMLGYLDHPSAEFDGLARGGPYQNLNWDGTEKIEVSANAKYVMPVDPDHAHDAVMEQISLDENGKPTMEGFVTSYERKGRGLSNPRLGGVFAPLIKGFESRKKKKASIEGRGPVIMESHDSSNIPVLSTLAKEFAVCQRWFCSVPGETWPNRNFMHAATSDGETNIYPRFYRNHTIFEQLEEAGADWRIYYDDTPQIWAFRELWDPEKRRAKWFHSSHFSEHVRDGNLPEYTFIEPNHRPPYHLVDEGPTVEKGDASNNQHPGNNIVSNAAYDDFHTDEPVDFVRAEALIANVYESLRANPQLFEKTLLLITYDEHGGCYDHVAPPTNVPNPGKRPSAFSRSMKWFFHHESKHFDFQMLGLRVPTVLVSPLIERNTVNSTVFDHSAIPATVRKLFAPKSKPLTARDAWSQTFEAIAQRNAARTDLPDLSQYVAAVHAPSRDEVEEQMASEGDGTHMPEYYGELVQLSDKVSRVLRRKGVTDAPVLPIGPKRQRAHKTTTAFRASAHALREQSNP